MTGKGGYPAGDSSGASQSPDWEDVNQRTLGTELPFLARAAAEAAAAERRKSAEAAAAERRRSAEEAVAVAVDRGTLKQNSKAGEGEAHAQGLARNPMLSEGRSLSQAPSGAKGSRPLDLDSDGDTALETMDSSRTGAVLGSSTHPSGAMQVIFFPFFCCH